jgi:[CysO sulfur-carrier protein]-S-L-cysteine hydrolase
MTLMINKTAYAVMLSHCQAEYPLEACGLLGGRDGQASIVTAVENILRSPVAYEMDPRQQIESMLYIENNGFDLMAAFHSHPHGPSQPSATDLAQAYYPDLLQVIISLRDRAAPIARAFLLTHEEFQEVSLLVV